MDQSKLERYLNGFSQVTGLKIALMDHHFRGILVSGYGAGEYCTLLHASSKCLEICISNVRAFEAARERGEPYILRCPFGLNEIVIPVQEGDVTVGYLIAGPIRQGDAEDKELLLRQLSENGLDGEEERASVAIERMLPYSAESVRSLRDLLSLLGEYIGLSGGMRDTEKTVGQTVKDYIKRNLSRKITLSELSIQAHCSTVTMTEHFKREFGVTIMEYVLKKRLTAAASFLQNSTLSIAEIAERCGFCNAEYFSRCFKRAYGMSPTRYRSQRKSL